MLGLFNLFMWRYIGNPANKLSQGLSRTEAKYFSFRALVVPAMFTLFAFIYLVNPLIASTLPMFVPVVMRLIQRQHDKKNKIKIIKTLE